MTNLSTAELAQKLKEADAAGDTQAASAFAQEWKTRRSAPAADPLVAGLSAATRVPEPQGFMEDSGINAFGRGVRENIGGGAGAALGGAAGLKGGAAVGTFLGGPGIGSAIGGGIGGIGGGILGALFGGQVQQAAFPTSEETVRILEADQQNHPTMSFAGQTLPYIATLKPSMGALKSAVTPLNAAMSTAERSAVMGNRVGTAFGAGMGAASEIAMPLIQGQEIDPSRVLASTVIGALLNEPNPLGKAIGLPSTPTLAGVRAKQMAASIPDATINVGGIPDERVAAAFATQPEPLALPEFAESGVKSVMPAMRQEQAAAMQEQLTRLTERRAGMVSRGVDKPALAALDVQIKARQNALKGLQNESTIIAPPAPESTAPVVETGVAVPPPDRTPVAVGRVEPRPTVPPAGERPAFVSADAITQAKLAQDAVSQSPQGAAALREQLAVQSGVTARETPIDPRMAARAAGTDVIATGERPAFMSADAITQERLARDAAAQSPSNAVALREQLSAQSERVNTIPEDLARARANMAKGGDEAVRVKANAEPVAAFRQQNGELKLYDGHHRLVNAIDSGAETLPVKIDGEGIKNIPLSAFDAATPTPHETIPAIPGKPAPADSVNPVSDVPSVVDTPEVTGFRRQIAKLDEDIFNAKADGDEYGATGLEIARRKVQSQLDEATNPTMPKSLGEKIRAKKVKVKGDKLLMPLLGISPDDARRAWNGALEVAARLADAGTHIRQAAKQAAAWVRSNFPSATFKDADFHRAVEADITNELPAARRAGAKDAAHAAADAMDNNPDKFFTDADSTPIKSYMDGVDKVMTDAKHDMMSGRTAKSVWQKIKDVNRHLMRGNQAALDDIAQGSAGTGRKSPALDKLNTEINGTRPGAAGVAKRGIWDGTQTRTRSRTNELSEAYNGIRKTVDTLTGEAKEAFLANLVKWQKHPNAAQHLRNQPEILTAVNALKKITRDIYNDLKAAGIDIGDAGPDYFSRQLDADYVRRNYDDFVTGMAKIYDMQWKQNDPKYVTDMAKATAAAKAYADASILGHEGIMLDGSDLNLGVKRSGDPDFFKARTFTGAAGEHLDNTMAKFYKRNPFETLNNQINRAERRIGLAKAFGKIDGNGVLDPTFKWREFAEAAKNEGNEKIIPEVLERYQNMFGIGGNFNPSTNAFNQFTRELGYYAYLPFSGINSLVEPTVIAMRLNKPVSGLFQSYGKAFRSISRQIKDMPLDYKEMAADRLGLAENATMQASRSLGKIDDQGLKSGKHLANYFFATGNSVVSNATANAAVDIGMSALRLELLEFARGKNKNGARIWLEELGIKKDDFDRVSQWLEGHATDQERFTKLFDQNVPEAGMVRDALRKFTREARSLPDAGSKSKNFSNPFGSLLLSLQSFLYDFTDKVLGRNARQFMQGVKGSVHFEGDVNPTQLSNEERVRLMAPMALGMPALLAANYGIAMVREALYPDPEKIRRDRERTAGEINWNRFTRSLSRTNALGPYDMLFNMFTQARYERDVAAMAVGPYMGGVLELAKNVAALSGERNSDNTNTAERKAVRSAWNIGPKPLINMALSSLPATRSLTRVAAAGIQMASQRSVTEGAVDLAAGRAQSGRSAPKKPKVVP